MALILDGTNGINFIGAIVAPDGSASAPSITNDGDTNTGIYFPAADNIGFATNGVIRGRWTTDGLCFGTDTAAANALDDYEEGTWTPTISGLTFSSAVGNYTKVGNICYVTFVLNSSNTSKTSQDINIGGLPFSGSNFNPNYAANSVVLTEVSNIAFAGGYSILYGRLLSGTELQLLQSSGAAHDAFTSGGGLNNAATIRGGFTYFVA